MEMTDPSPLFGANGVESSNEICWNKLRQILLNSSNYFTSYFDATGKLSSSLLGGNGIFLGDYGACQKLNESLYCVADLTADLYPPLQENFSSVPLRWGLCVVKQCNEAIIQTHASSLIKGVLGLPWIEVLNSTVHCARDIQYLPGFYATLILLLLLLLFCVVGTVLDSWYRHTSRMRWKLIYTINNSGPHLVPPPSHPRNTSADRCQTADGVMRTSSTNALCSDDESSSIQADEGESVAGLGNPPSDDLLERAYAFKPDLKVKIGKCFSFHENVKSLSVSYTDEIVCLHGLRVLSMACVVLGQTYLAAYSSDLIGNRHELEKMARRTSFQIIASYYYAVDTFLIISGLLLSFSGLKRIGQNRGKFQLLSYFLRRLLRFVPSLCVLLMLWIYVKPYVTDGPVWFRMQNDTLCARFWWTNLLFVENFYPTSSEDQCVGWLWYLALDFQLYSLSAVLLYALYSFRGRGVMITAALMLCSMVVMATVIGYLGVEVNPVAALSNMDHKMFERYLDAVLTKPYCHIFPYLTGLLLGWKIHHERGILIQIKSCYVLLGWFLCIVLGLAAVYAPYPQMLGYHYGSAGNAICGMLSQVAWSLATAWFIYACRHLCAGPLNRVLSWNGWLVLGRLTYGAFLLHGLIMSVYFYGLQDSFHVSDTTMISAYLLIFLFTYLISFLLWLLVESPIAHLSILCQP